MSKKPASKKPADTGPAVVAALPVAVVEATMAGPGDAGAADSPPQPPVAKSARPKALQPAAAKPAVTEADRNNPRKLTGQALKDLAHRMGISRSEAAGLSDERLREQLRYRTSHMYESEEA